jgi:hypothetical protein
VPPFAIGRVPVTPVERGKPVALVSVALVGVPKTGVTNVGLMDKTVEPDPVEVVVPVPPLATGNVPVTFVAKFTKVVDVVPVPPLAIGKVPVTPVERGSPVALVSVTDVGVPKIGVTNVGLVDRTVEPEPVEVVTPVPPEATGRAVLKDKLAR